jgi:hypothetical protein
VIERLGIERDRHYHCVSAREGRLLFLRMAATVGGIEMETRVYQLATHPAQPLRAEALPAAVAKHCVRVPRPFREITSLNPPEHWRCESWEPGWLDSDGKTVHVFPGREKDFEEAAANYGPEIVIDRGNANGGPAPKPWWKLW